MRVPPAPQVSPDRFVTVLFVGSHSEDRQALQEIFAHTNWRLTTVDTPARAIATLRSEHHAVVICERHIQEGSWKDLLERTRTMPSHPLLIVTSHHPDNYLWAEALNLGAYDVLPKPFDRQEVVHVVSAAWLYWLRRLRFQERPTAERQLVASCA